MTDSEKIEEIFNRLYKIEDSIDERIERIMLKLEELIRIYTPE